MTEWVCVIVCHWVLVLLQGLLLPKPCTTIATWLRATMRHLALLLLLLSCFRGVGKHRANTR